MTRDTWDYCPQCSAVVEGIGAQDHCAKTEPVNLDSYLAKGCAICEYVLNESIECQDCDADYFKFKGV